VKVLVAVAVAEGEWVRTRSHMVCGLGRWKIDELHRHQSLDAVEWLVTDWYHCWWQSRRRTDFVLLGRAGQLTACEHACCWSQPGRHGHGTWRQHSHYSATKSTLTENEAGQTAASSGSVQAVTVPSSHRASQRQKRGPWQVLVAAAAAAAAGG